MDKNKCPILKNGFENFTKKSAKVVLEHNALFLKNAKKYCDDKFFLFF